MRASVYRSGISSADSHAQQNRPIGADRTEEPDRGHQVALASSRDSTGPRDFCLTGPIRVDGFYVFQ
jgi:hypothetical protein